MCIRDRAGTVQTFPPARDAHVLARAAEGNDIHRLNLPAVHPGDIAVMLHKRQPLGGHPDRKFIAHCYEGEKPLLKDVLTKGEDALVLIGPCLFYTSRCV